MNLNKSNFYVVAREAGAQNPSLPTWATSIENPINLDEDRKNKLTRNEVSFVPGAFKILNVFSKEETTKFKEVTEELGYTEDAAVSLPRSVRHNNNLTWVIDNKTHDIIWDRVKDFMFDKDGIFDGKKVLGINKRFRFYRYDEGDFFKVHSDGSWPGSAVIERELVQDAYLDRYSQMTFLIFLSEDFKGGETQFYVDKTDVTKPTRDIQNAELINIRTPEGSVLCFPHGFHPLHCLHSSSKILSGVKYIIRTDVLFEI